MAEFVPAVGNILSLIERRDWTALERSLSPDVVWITAVEERLDGPAEIITALREDPVPGPPAFHEVDEDGRLTYWVDKMG